MFKPALRFSPLLLALLPVIQSCGIVRPLPVQIAGDFSSARFDPDTVTAHPGESIRWSNLTNATVTLQFGRAPVEPRTIVVLPGGTGTVRVSPDATPNRYKYTAILRVGDQVVTIDPYIDVQPRGGDQLEADFSVVRVVPRSYPPAP
jgi:hypothetical protein